MEISQRVLSLIYNQKGGIFSTGIEFRDYENYFTVNCFNGYAIAESDTENEIYYLLEYPKLEELTQEQLNYVYHYVTASNINDTTIDLINENDVMLAYGKIVK